MTKRAVLIGAGRMGLTHLAQLNLLTDFSLRWTVVEPSAAVRAGLSYFLPGDMLEKTCSSPGKLRGDFDYAVITSPTVHHDSAWQALKNRAGRFLIEKPLRVSQPDARVLCGYVLLHHPLQKRLVACVGDRTPRQVSLSLKANTILGPNTGWRGLRSGGGGVLNEFGSHLLSLLVDIAGPVDALTLLSSRTVHSVDVPDIARLEGRARSGAAVSISLDWTDASVRKPSFEVSVEMEGGQTLWHDFYELVEGDRRLSIAQLESAAGVYLRGLEFTEQARHFLDAPNFEHPLSIAVEVDRLLEALA